MTLRIRAAQERWLVAKEMVLCAELVIISLTAMIKNEIKISSAQQTS